MVRLNGRIASRRNTSSEDESNGSLFSKKVSFFGLLGATMAALKLKEQWDGYRKVPTESNATNHPIAPPAYRDDDCDTESTIGLDTSITMSTRPRRKRGCCVCCGLNCGLFCRALGIVILIFTLWNGFKLAKWLLTLSPTGLENMPEFSKSLGCLDAAHFYQDSADGTFYTIDVGSDVDHDLIIDGGAVGTVVVKPSTSIAEGSIKVRAIVRASDSRLLNSVEVHTPESAPLPPSGNQSTSYFRLATPIEAESALACMRYDLTVYLPPNLRTLRIISSSVAQVKVDFDDTPRELHLLSLDLNSQAAANLLLPSAELIADNVDITMRGGYIVGTLPVANSTRVDTRVGDAITKLDLFTSGYALPEIDEETRDNAAVAHVTTITGTGRSDFSYDNRAVRPIRSEHSSRGLGDSELYLTYGKARFNGKIEVEARSFSMRHVQSDGLGSHPGDHSRERWAGDKDGGDFLKVTTPGWVGLYF